MINTLIAIKKNMGSSYDTRGRRVGTTVLEIAPNIVTQVKTLETKDGYNAIQLGLGSRKYMKKPQMGHLKKNNIDQNVKYFREIRTEEVDLNPGQEIKASDIFFVGDLVKVSGVSKGRGFQGGMKRHGFHGGPKTHGQSDRHRAPGSIGSTTTPGRVYKGKKMAGHSGVERVSLKNLEVVALDKENNLLTLKGGVPGYNGALVMVEKIGHVKNHIPDVVKEMGEEETEEVVKEEAAPEAQVSENMDNAQAEQKEAADQSAEAPVEEVTNVEAETPEDVKAEETEGEKE